MQLLYEMRRQGGAKKAAFGGLLTAFAVVVLIISGFLPNGSFVMPILAGLAVYVAAKEFSWKIGLAVYVTTGALGLILCVNKMCVLYFILIFGYYPLLHEAMERIKFIILKILTKAVIFALSYIAVWAVGFFVFGISVEPYTVVGLDAAVVTGAGFLLFMFVYDFLFSKLRLIYGFKVHPYIKKLLKL